MATAMDKTTNTALARFSVSGTRRAPSAPHCADSSASRCIDDPSTVSSYVCRRHLRRAAAGLLPGEVLECGGRTCPTCVGSSGTRSSRLSVCAGQLPFSACHWLVLHYEHE